MEEFIELVFAEAWRPADNPYLLALAQGRFEREDFVETQIQFGFAVAFFSRPMAVAAARVPDAASRLEIVRNIWEEHGNGRAGAMHERTFRELLRRLGVIQDEDIERRALWPEVRAFNTALMGACASDEYLVSLAALGMIEQMFAEISAALGRGIVERGWLRREELVHYTAHEKLDVKHARDFFAILAPAWQDPTHRYYVEQGLRMGAYLFDGLYAALYQARGRRLTRQATGPHVRS